MKYIVWLLLIVLILCIVICAVIICFLRNENNAIKAEAQKQFRRAEFNSNTKKMLELWLRQKHDGKELKPFFIRQKIERVAIYGMTQTAALLYKELLEAGVKVICGIDRSGKTGGMGLIPKKPSDLKKTDLIGKVDAIIVTPIYDFSSIYDLLYEIVGDKIPILGLDEILCEI